MRLRLDSLAHVNAVHGHGRSPSDAVVGSVASASDLLLLLLARDVLRQLSLAHEGCVVKQSQGLTGGQLGESRQAVHMTKSSIRTAILVPIRTPFSFHLQNVPFPDPHKGPSLSPLARPPIRVGPQRS